METKIIKHQEGIEITKEKIEALKSFFKKFEEIKKSILSKEDIVEIQGNEFIKRSGWERIAKLFNLSVEIIDRQRIENDKKVVYIYTIKVIAPSGIYAVAEGVCSSDEKGKENKPEFVLSGIAQTRAFNRAVRMLVGGGGLSYEEIDEDIVAEEIKEKIIEGEYSQPREMKKDIKQQDEKNKNKLIYYILNYVEDELKKGKSKEEIFSFLSNIINKEVKMVKNLSNDDLQKIYDEIYKNNKEKVIW